jgi:nitroreductase
MTTNEVTKVISGGIEYTKEDIKKLDEVSHRGLLHERIHHGIEVPIYPIVLKWKGEAIAGFGLQPQIVYDAWVEKGYPVTDEDLVWAKRYLDLAAQIRAGKKPHIPEIKEALPIPFTKDELKVVHKLIWDRRTSRGGWLAKEVSDEVIAQICEAGRAAPIGCNLDEVRFVILKTEEEKKLIRSDVSTENGVIIVICYDKRPAAVVGQDRPERVPHNRGFDCAAAGDHMGLMAQALGLTSVWLSDSPGGGKKFKEAWGLPEELEVAMHFGVGWPAAGSIKSARVPLEYMFVRKGK